MFIKIILISFLIIEIYQIIDRKDLAKITLCMTVANTAHKNAEEVMPKSLFKKTLIYTILTLYYVIALCALCFTHAYIPALCILTLCAIKSILKAPDWFIYIDAPITIGLILYGLLFL